VSQESAAASPGAASGSSTGDAATAAHATAASGSNAAGAADGRPALRAQDGRRPQRGEAVVRRVLRSGQLRAEVPGAGCTAERPEWLKRWPTTKVSLEGHCDSRGTPEYNLGLGERRASTVRDYLVSLGVTGDRILAVSKGKEAPFCTEENEACWSQNRRGHFVFTAK